MLDKETRAIKLGEAFGMSSRVAGWLACDTRSALGHIWAGLVYLNIPYYIVFVVSLLIYMGDGVDRSQAVLLLVIPLALYSHGTRQLVIKDVFLMMQGVSKDLDNLEQRVKRMEALQPGTHPIYEDLEGR